MWMRSARRVMMAMVGLGGAPFATVRSAAAQTAGALLDRPARLEIQDRSLVRALQQLSERSRVSLVYSPSLLPADARVSCACGNATTRQALDTLLASTGFTFRESDGHVILVLQPVVGPRTGAGDDSAAAPASPLAAGVPDAGSAVSAVSTITGRVTSESGVPIDRAVVTMPSARVSATTSEDGGYQLVVPTEGLSARAQSLHVIRLGYRPVVVAARLAPGRQTVDVVMSANVLTLDQVVVTGTAGNQERRAQSAVVATIDAEELLAKVPARGIDELIYAQTPGVSMTVASGTSGANTRIDIRGQASIALTNYPLFFVDGVRVIAGPRGMGGNNVGGQSLNALDDLNPDDVQRIEVVKGPAAATLYGADASAGVIQIFTKRGRPGARRSSQKAMLSVDRIDPNFAPFDNYAACPADLVAPSSMNPLCRGLPVGTVVSDNVLARNKVFGSGQSTMASVATRGGGDAFGYYASAEGSNERGTTPSSSLNRRSGRVNFTWSTAPSMSIDANFGLVRTKDRLPKGDQDTMGFLLGGDFGSPLSVFAAPDGSLAGGWYQHAQAAEAIAAINTSDETLRLTPSLQFRYSPRSWLSNRVTVGMDYAHTLATQHYPKNDFNWYTGLQNSGQISATDLRNTLYTVDYLGNVSTRLGRGKWISSDLSFGSQWVTVLTESLAGFGQGLVTNANTLVTEATTTVSGQSYSHAKSLGYFVQQQLGFNDRLFVQAAARIDRNSAFGSKVGSFFLPKVGASWIVSDEPFWPRRSLPLSALRVRAAYGTTGRSPSSAASLQTFVKSNYLTDGGQVLPGISPGSPGNASLRPERGTELEAGIDAGFFGDRLALEATYFDKRSRNLLLSLPIAPSAGFSSSPLANIGEVGNSGVELSIRATPLTRADAAWDVAASMNTIRNRILSMGSVTPFANTNNQCFKPGNEVGAWCVPRVVSVDTIAGRAIVTDTAVNVGGQLPRYEAALSSTLTVRGFRLYAQLDGKFDYKIHNATQDFRDRTAKNSAGVNLPAGAGGYSARERLRRMGPFVTETTGMVVGVPLVRDAYIVPADFVRLREVSATWSLPTSLGERVGIAGSSITVGGRNLWLATKYTGLDPEVNGADLQTFLYRADLFTIPQTRRVFARLTVQF